MSFPDMVSQSLSLLENDNLDSLTTILSDALQSQGIKFNETIHSSVDVVDDDELVTIYVDIPGVNTDTISMDFSSNVLYVSGMRARPYQDDEVVIHRNETAYGTFKRKIKLPINVTNKENVSTTIMNGVLIISINKANENSNMFSIKFSNN